ncbi:peptidase M48 Ste24p family protein [Nitzschia inconspicua]|uniref:Peptidase M48 Ste24p family protein n=1 Tax=Nitzschia inconspicua TaxID=303405 RepID=A0A9K3LXL4_9STRA|nr:peptidase M48 Ste24p family protein [Nitzschia inconspicua]
MDRDDFFRHNNYTRDGPSTTTRQRREGRRQRRPDEDGTDRSNSGNRYTSDQSRTSSRKSTSTTRTTATTSSSWKHQLLLVLGGLVSLGVWYLTPLSEVVVEEFLLPLVPVASDVEMGQQALLELKGGGGRSHRDGRRTNDNNNGSPSSSSSSSSTSKDTARDVYDPHWTPLIQSIGWELVDAATTTDRHRHNQPKQQQQGLSAVPIDEYAWDFGLIQQSPPIVNAFCLPGGIIRITHELLRKLRLTHGELAALIGHEMGHAIHRHAQARRLQHQVVSCVLKALVYQDDDDHQESFGEAVGELLVNSADWLGRQSFSRRDEYQADATSWDLLVASKRYDPRAMQTLLQKLWTYHGRQGGHTSWESTHPGTLDRIEALEQKYQALSNTEKKRLQRHNTIS